MLKQSLKDLYFSANRILVKPNTWMQKQRLRSKTDLIVHLGSGDDYREGMINVDGNIMRKRDLWLDLRNPLPFAEKSVKLLYSCHMLEHVFPLDAIKLLKEMHRVISEDGVVRLAVPSFERCLRIAAGEDESHWPRDFEDSKSQAINYLFCDGQHKYAYCDGNLRQFAKEAGFEGIENVSEVRGEEPSDYFGIELGNEPPGSLIFELRR